MKKPLRIVLIVLLSTLMLFSLWRAVMIQIGYRNADELYKELRNQHVQSEVPPPSGEAATEDAFPTMQIDLEGLREINPEVTGWIWIPDTKVNYPFLQGTDNQNYLNKSYRQGNDVGGSVFMDYRNQADLSDDNTILYGHNMKNGAMFGGLKKFADQSYRDAHPYIYLATQDGILKYRIFAAYKTESTSQSYTRNLSGNQDAFLRYIASCTEGSQTALPDKQSRMITLSTCTSVRRTERFVVHGVFVGMNAREAETTVG